MPRSRPQLAKLTRPRLHNAVARERLFALLDEARDTRRAICVIGPPGAGKTTLVASWLDARRIPGIWYQVDPGDADLATLFHYLRLAAESFARKGRARLPALTPEYLADVPGFARRFFRELFARLPARATLVLDNYQEVVADAQFHEIVANAMQELPEGLTLIAVSRRDPPDCYARLIVNEDVAFVDWEQLKLTLQEARDVASARGCHGADRVESLYAQSDGWAAGLTLLLDQAAVNAAPVGFGQRSHTALFGYFAEQAFGRLPEATRRFLMETAILPTVPVSVAEALTGNVDAGSILDDLYRRRLFTHRRAGTEPTYWYHALFRDFLLAQAQQHMSQVQRSDAARRAAPLLAAACRYEDAFALYRQAQEWRGAASLALERAEDLLAAGRWQTLREWIENLPAQDREANPWLEFWLGNALMPVDQIAARLHLERAFRRLKELGDAIGQMRTASSIVACYFFQWSTWRPLDRWIDVLEGLMVTHPRYPSDAVEFDILSSMLIATLYRRPDHPLLPLCADRIEALLSSDVDVNRKVAGATLFLTYCNLANHLERAESVVAATQALLQSDDITPLNRVWWCSRWSFLMCITGRHASVGARVQAAYEIIKTHGLTGFRGGRITLDAHLQWSMLCQRDWDAATALTRSMAASARSAYPSEIWQATQAAVRLALSQGDLAAALEVAPACVEAAFATGMIYLEVMGRLYWAEALAESARFPDAADQVRRCRDLIRGGCLTYYEPELLVLEAYVARRQGDRHRCHGPLVEGFALARRVNALWKDGRLFGRVLPAMCSEALSSGIEPGYVGSLVQRLDLRPISHDDEAWPWPVKIYTLGRFEILRDGRLLAFAHKAPRKQLLVLKALLAFGGREVPVQRVCDAIWPNQDGDGSSRALGVNLARLRTLLGSQDAIAISDERISLNPERCWWDARVFDRLTADRASAARDAEVLAMYRGPFLATDSDQPWTVPLRERFRTRFVTHLQRSAARFEADGEWAGAIATYSRGIETDELAEGFYQGLMRCYRHLGRPAEGLAAYRRLRQILSVLLGIAPTAESESLYRALREMGTPQSASA